MAALMPGWQRAPGWTLSDKRYLSPGETSEREVLPGTPKAQIHTYEVKFDKTINLYISPGDVIEITRILEDNEYKEQRTFPYRNQIDGGLDEWIETLTKDLCDTNWERTNFEVGGGFIKGDDFCKIKVTYKKYTPPIPSIVIGNIEVILSEMRKNADNVDYVMELKKELDRLLTRNNLTRKDIEDLIKKEGLEDELL
jgi:hypothetical protein